MERPKVSVIIPCHNGADYIQQTVQSVLNQSFEDREVIVVDDASTDSTPDKLAELGDKIKTVTLTGKGNGPARPRNKGVEAARGELIALFDADDLMVPGKLEEQVQFLEKNPNVPLVFSNFSNFNETGVIKEDFLSDHEEFQKISKNQTGPDWFILPSAEAYEALISNTFIGMPSVMMRKSLFTKVGGFDESLTNSDDVDMWFRITHSYDIGYINKKYFLRRIHGKNISSNFRALFAKRIVYERQKARVSTPSARRALSKFLSDVYFSIGYKNRLEGNKREALKNYWLSWRQNKSGFRVFLSMAKAIVS